MLYTKSIDVRWFLLLLLIPLNAGCATAPMGRLVLTKTQCSECSAEFPQKSPRGQCQQAMCQTHLPPVAASEALHASAPLQVAPDIPVDVWTPTEHAVRSVSPQVVPEITTQPDSPPAIPPVAIPPVARTTDVLQPVPDCNICGNIKNDPCPPPTISPQQLSALMQRMTTMERMLKESRNSIVVLHTTLRRANEKVKRLTDDVRHWQGEVRRLEVSIKTQHESDIKSLSDVSEILGALVDSGVSVPDVEGTTE